MRHEHEHTPQHLADLPLPNQVGPGTPSAPGSSSAWALTNMALSRPGTRFPSVLGGTTDALRGDMSQGYAVAETMEALLLDNQREEAQVHGSGHCAPRSGSQQHSNVA